MKKERKNVKVADIMLNEGQVQWLPKNPRQWIREDFDRTKKSLEEDADFLEDRPILLIEHEGKYVTFAGNLRTSAAKELGMKNVPAVIYVHEDDADRETIKRRAMKDNGSFGAWDFDALANEWDGLPLADWGVPAWNTDIIADDDLLSKSDSRGANAVSFGGEGFKMVLGNRTFFVDEKDDFYQYCKELEEYMDNSEGNEILKDILCEILTRYTSLKN